MSSPVAAGERAASQVFENVTCPFCGMLCDDLEVERSGETLKVRKNGCGRAVAGFERRLPPASAMVGGRQVALEEAVRQAAALIGKAKFPLYGGLGTDVEGIRAVLALAERSGGVVDHALSEAQYRNLSILQTIGWTTSTLTETRNRADLIIVLGPVRQMHPRFFERIASPPDSLFDVTPPKRTVVFIGAKPEDAAGLQAFGKILTLPCPVAMVGDVLAALRARLRGAPVKSVDFGGTTLAEIEALAERCRNAKYGVVVWAPSALNFAYAELAVDHIIGLVKDLNKTGRFAGLSFGGAEGSASAGSVCTWQSGYPLRVSYASGAPDYDPFRYAIGRMLAEGEGDLLVWVASFMPDLGPPVADLPSIILGTPGIALPRMPEVFIPTGTPGVDHKGRLVRCDSVVTLPLKNLGRAPLPRAADVLAAIEAAL